MNSLVFDMGLPCCVIGGELVDPGPYRSFEEAIDALSQLEIIEESGWHSNDGDMVAQACSPTL